MSEEIENGNPDLIPIAPKQSSMFLFKLTDDVIKIADLLIKNEEYKLVEKLLTYFSENELKNGLYLTMSLAESIEKRFRILPKPNTH